MEEKTYKTSHNLVSFVENVSFHALKDISVGGNLFNGAVFAFFNICLVVIDCKKTSRDINLDF